MERPSSTSRRRPSGASPRAARRARASSRASRRAASSRPSTPPARCRATTGTSACASSSSTATRNVGTALQHHRVLPRRADPLLALADRSRSTTSARPASSRRPSAPPGRAASSSRCPTTGTSPRTRTRPSRPKLFTKRGVQLGAEFRYLRADVHGQLDVEFLPNDRIADSDRYFLGVKHIQQLWPRLDAGGQRAEGLRRQLLPRPVDARGGTSQTNLPRDAILGYNDDVWSLLGARARLPDPAGSARRPVTRSLHARCRSSSAPACKQNVYGFDWQFVGELSQLPPSRRW